MRDLHCKRDCKRDHIIDGEGLVGAATLDPHCCHIDVITLVL